MDARDTPHDADERDAGPVQFVRVAPLTPKTRAPSVLGSRHRAGQTRSRRVFIFRRVVLHTFSEYGVK